MATLQFTSANGSKKNAATVQRAVHILEQEMRHYGVALNSPIDVRNYLRLQLASLQHEVFTCIFLNVHNQVIEAREMFRGTLDSTAIYPREVVRAALDLNAASVTFAHNHPTGDAEPSIADKAITKALCDALKGVDVQVHDHFVIAPCSTFSFSEQGLMRDMHGA